MIAPIRAEEVSPYLSSRITVDAHCRSTNRTSPFQRRRWSVLKMPSRSPSGRKSLPSTVPPPGQSLADVRPLVAGEWHHSRNAPLTPFDVKPASAKLVWWQCAEGHEWQTKPQNRLREERCPECSKKLAAIKRATPAPGRSLADLYPTIADEWHSSRNGTVTARDVNAGSKTKRWFTCRVCNFDWETDPDHRTRSNRGCPQSARKKNQYGEVHPKTGKIVRRQVFTPAPGMAQRTQRRTDALRRCTEKPPKSVVEMLVRTRMGSRSCTANHRSGVPEMHHHRGLRTTTQAGLRTRGCWIRGRPRPPTNCGHRTQRGESRCRNS